MLVLGLVGDLLVLQFEPSWQRPAKEGGTLNMAALSQGSREGEEGSHSLSLLSPRRSQLQARSGRLQRRKSLSVQDYG